MYVNLLRSKVHELIFAVKDVAPGSSSTMALNLTCILVKMSVHIGPQGVQQGDQKKVPLPEVDSWTKACRVLPLGFRGKLLELGLDLESLSFIRLYNYDYDGVSGCEDFHNVFNNGLYKRWAARLKQESNKSPEARMEFHFADGSSATATQAALHVARARIKQLDLDNEKLDAKNKEVEIEARMYERQSQDWKDELEETKKQEKIKQARTDGEINKLREQYRQAQNAQMIAENSLTEKLNSGELRYVDPDVEDDEEEDKVPESLPCGCECQCGEGENRYNESETGDYDPTMYNKEWADDDDLH